MTKTNSFFRRGSGVYECRICGRKTRATGQGEENFELCVDCSTLQEQVNAVNDGSETPEGFLAGAARYIANIAAKGGNVERAKSACGGLFPTS